MIGGAMLLCAVSAMALITVWSIRRDEAPDTLTRDGFLALKNFSKVKKYSLKNQDTEEPGKAVKSREVRKIKKLYFDPDEMAEIEDEADATLPEFIRNAREEHQ